MSLRPLSFGGILERSLALYAQSFAPIVGLVAVTVVPVAVVQYLVMVRAGRSVEATFAIFQHPQRLQTQHGPTLFNSPGTLAIVIASALFAYYMLGFAMAAVCAAVARRYDGEPIGFRACYEAVIPRWGAIVALVGAAVLALIAAYMVAVVVVLVPVFIAAALGVGLPSVVTPAVGAMLVAIGFAFMLILISTTCALCAVVVENYPAAWSLRLTIERIFNRQEFWRAIWCAFTVAAIGLAASTLVDTLAFAALSRWPSAYVGVDALERIVIVPLLALIVAFYYFDIRVRHEGYDLTTTLGAGDEEPLYAPTAYLSGDERALIKRFLERRNSLQANRRREIAAKLAAPVRQRVPPELGRLDDEPLLERLG